MRTCSSAQHLGRRRPQAFEPDRQPAPQLAVGHRGRRGEGRLLDQDAALAQVERVEEGRPGVAAGAVGIRRRPVHQRARPGREGWAVEAGEEAERRLVGARRTGPAQQPWPAAARRVDDQPDRRSAGRRPAAGGCPNRSAGRRRPRPRRLDPRLARTRPRAPRAGGRCRGPRTRAAPRARGVRRHGPTATTCGRWTAGRSVRARRPSSRTSPARPRRVPGPPARSRRRPRPARPRPPSRPGRTRRPRPARRAPTASAVTRRRARPCAGTARRRSGAGGSGRASGRRSRRSR